MAQVVVVRSAVQSVQVFRAGAVVTRVAELPSEDGAWPKEVLLEGLPLALEDDSLRASIVGKQGAALPAPCDLRVELALPALGGKLEAASDVQARVARQEVQRFEAAIARVDRELGRLDRLALRLPEPFENRPPRPAPVAAWVGTLEWQARVRRSRLEEKTGHLASLRKAREELARLERRDEEARAQRDALADAISKRVRLSLRGGGPAIPCLLRLEYRVPGARWFPSYQVRVARGGSGAQLTMRALVAQKTGEGWSGVQLSVSTADLEGDAELPELPSIRIGRRQRSEPKRAWREPPPGAEGLFEGLDRALEAAPRNESTRGEARPFPEPEPVLPQAPLEVPAVAAALGEALVPGTEFEVIAPAPAAAPPPSAPQALRGATTSSMKRLLRSEATGVERARKLREDGDEGPAVPDAAADAEPAPTELSASADQLRFSTQVMVGYQDPARRGRLRAMKASDAFCGGVELSSNRLTERLEAAAREARGVLAFAVPAGASEVRESSGAYDYCYRAEAPVDVPADGVFHVIPIAVRAAPVQSTFVAVPRESDRAVRVASMENPLGSPLLAGPADVYLEDEYVATSPLRTAPAGGMLELGLGAEEALKVARQVFFEEVSHGLMGGGTTLRHRVEIEVASRLSAPAQVEVRECVPIVRDGDKDIELAVPPATPPWEDFDQAPAEPLKGGRRWRFSLAPGEAQKLAFTYAVKIDSKNELVGGNRRE